ncbi:hypothetical protein [Kitasatospora sp. GAS204B]|uniref:Rv1733c family protein n=1 Tax=unclassified Kitasatospora TaxID=2633591 RepID=UPI002472FFAE|nr:hypothetical protein [Kitasatospora sp. GAS204B]MDH6122387.1 hypothetical protein [Kitasatospora sp. GAS204B]
MFAISASHRHTAVRTCLVRQLRRALGQDPNPLCRPVDRARSQLLVAAALALALAAPLATLLALALLSSMRAQNHQIAAHRHQVTAITLAVASNGLGLDTASARASWDYPQAEHRSGTVSVAAKTAPGSSVPLWVDDSGNPAAPPPLDSQLAVAAGLCGLGVFLATGTVVWTTYVVHRHTLTQQAEQAWEPAWEQIEPLWSGRSWRPEDGER